MRLLISVTMMLLICSASYAQKQGQDKDWALYSRYAEANDTITVAPKAVFMGNSITENWLKFHPDFFRSHGYAARGISGQTTYHMLARFHSDVVALKPKAVVILSGINDIARNSGIISLENIMGNIISMCDIARANGIVPILCSILPADRFSWRPDLKPAPLVVELNGMIKAYAQEAGLEYVDYYTSLADENGALKEGLSKDHCHPYPEVYVPMEETIVKAIEKVTGKKGAKKRRK
ncbi:MAG: acylhydrolase [Bacteroidales bacterium]|nr:acylhydrolase [Bacteroidales bacterium]MBR4087820.1 acylhydrolase [Bacteroidales bacterium]